MYAILSSGSAGGKLGTLSTMSTQRFPSVARSTSFLTPLLAPSPPPPTSPPPPWSLPFPATAAAARAPRRILAPARGGRRGSCHGCRIRRRDRSPGTKDGCGLHEMGGFRGRSAMGGGVGNESSDRERERERG